VRSFYIAIGLATLLIGLALLFAGYVDVGCSVGSSGTTPTLSNCSGATDLEIIGGGLCIAAGLMFAVSFVPYDSPRVR